MISASARGLRVLTVTNMYPQPERPSYGSFVQSQVESLRDAGIATDVLFIDGASTKTEYGKAVSRIRETVLRRPYDLIHAHYGLSGFVSGLQRTVPLVVSFCGDDLLGTPGGLFGKTVLSRAICATSQAAARRADAIIVKSEEMRRQLWSRNDRQRANVIPNGVNLRVFRPIDRAEAVAVTGLDPLKRYILFPHTPYEVRKRIDLAEAAVAQLKKRRADAELLVVYHKPPSLLPFYYSVAEAMLLTSDWEGSPNVVKEALACGTPVVAVPAGDVRERLSGVPGCHVCARSPTSLADALEEVLGCARPPGIPQAVAALDTSLVARRIVKIYEDVVSEARGAGS